MNRTTLHCCLAVLLLGSLLLGCNPPATKKDQSAGKPAAGTPETPAAPQVTKIVRQRRSSDEAAELVESAPAEAAPEFDFSFNGSSEFSFDNVSAGSAAAGTGMHEARPGVSTAALAGSLGSLLQDAVDYGPTLAVWLIDRSPSARQLVRDLAASLAAPYGELKRDGDRFLSAVCTFGDQVEYPVDPPASDPAAVMTAFDGLGPPTGSQERLLSAVAQCLEKYGRYRSQGREVLLIIVTDEAGDDQEQLDTLIAQVRRGGIAIYTLGVPAPLGLPAALAPSVEGSTDPSAIRQGPESRQSEHARLGFWGGASDLDLVDSGFGPFALEYLTRASRGRYLAVRPPTSGGFSFAGALNTEWPSPGVWQPEPSAMRRYAPDYVSQTDYDSLLNSNAACRAVHEAAKLPPIQITQHPQTTFVKQGEAELANELARAQQFAAKLEPAVNRLYETLEKGEADRDKLTSPRWQASFDLAYGRAAAMKARVDGYNVMLAEVRRGKNFANAGSTTWELQPAVTTEATSQLRKLGESARQTLERVVAEHPGTPWAKLAERELATPVGWKWTER